MTGISTRMASHGLTAALGAGLLGERPGGRAVTLSVTVWAGSVQLHETHVPPTSLL